MKSVALHAVVRTVSRRNENKKLRAAGRIPAVIYGRQIQPQNLEVNAKELTDVMHHVSSENILVDLSVKDDTRANRLALIQEVQHHPVSGQVLHVDFHEVAENELVTLSVPVETTGEAAGVKNSGGVIQHVSFKLKVRALPKNLPEQIVLDVSSLEINRAIHVGDIKPPEGVEILGHKEAVVVACAPPRAEVVEVVAAEVAPAAGDVEMTKEKKVDGTEAVAPKAGDKAAAPKAGDKAVAPKAGEKAPAPAADKKAEKKK